MPNDIKESIGWKAFFALFTILQIIGIGAMWRTVDGLTELTQLANRNDIRIREVILPKLLESSERISHLEKQNLSGGN